MKTKQNTPIILASTSPWRAGVFKDFSLDFTALSPLENEDDFKQEVEKLPIAKQALELGRIKGRLLSAQNPESYVVSGDQIGELKGQPLFKAKSIAEAAVKMREMSGGTNKLHSSVVLFKNGVEIWHHVDTTEIGIRPLKESEIEAYLATETDALRVAGVIKLEGLGKHFISHTKGDYYSILGMPIYPLLTEFYRLGVLEVLGVEAVKG